MRRAVANGTSASSHFVGEATRRHFGRIDLLQAQ
jgi:hypothetical protein